MPMAPIYGLLLISFSLIVWLAFIAFKQLAKGWSLKVLFKDFKRKMWMTTCLGILFFGIYLLFVFAGLYLTNNWESDLFFLLYHHPVEFIYGGLWLFACLSLSIYLARMFIKYLFLTRGKDN